MSKEKQTQEIENEVFELFTKNLDLSFGVPGAEENNKKALKKMMSEMMQHIHHNNEKE